MFRFILLKINFEEHFVFLPIAIFFTPACLFLLLCVSKEFPKNTMENITQRHICPRVHMEGPINLIPTQIATFIFLSQQTPILATIKAIFTNIYPTSVCFFFLWLSRSKQLYCQDLETKKCETNSQNLLLQDVVGCQLTLIIFL